MTERMQRLLPTCRSCQAPILWAITSKTGRSMPLDPEPHAGGNVAIIGKVVRGLRRDRPLVHVLGPDDLAQARIHGEPCLFLSHFATCPEAAAWRQKGDS